MSALRDAVRLLFVLNAGSRPLMPTSDTGAVATFVGETRLQAFDFWMRYPDYLADELLDLYAASQEEVDLDQVERIFQENEPDLRRIPMIRYRFGAFEKVDTAISVLASRRLVKRVEHRSGVKVIETEFLLYPSAGALTERIRSDFPILKWYAQRSALVARVAGEDGGAALKRRQYARIEYAATPGGAVIPAITQAVRSRLELVRGQA